jgi:hypothetical protein
MRFKKFFFVVCLVAVAGLAKTFADVIPSDRVINWVPNVTVGVRGGIPSRTHQIDVTQSPYNADKTGKTDASAAITAAINAAQINDVVYLPAGVYNITAGLSITHSYFTLRGAGTNTILVGNIKVGYDANGGAGSYVVASGATKGSTSMQFASLSRLPYGDSVSVGDIIYASALIDPTDLFQYAVVGGDAKYARLLEQPILVTAITGNTVSFTPPLAWDFTNSPQAHPENPTQIPSLQPRHGVGIENMLITTTNNGLDCSPTFLVEFTSCVDSWLQNCEIYLGANYNVYLVDSVHCEVSHNSIRFAKGSGSNHAGLLAGGDSGCLVQDNIFADGLQPAIEFNTGFSGNAVFGNFFTNDIIYIDCHGPHPVMNLWEANICDSLEMDGYFGSASHQTLFRNVFNSGYTALLFKRWITYMQVVGNVLGKSGATYTQFASDPNVSAPVIIQFGYPNIGNNNYVGTSPPMGWNWPGSSFWDFNQHLRPNGIFTFPSDQILTTNLIGNFTNVPAPVASLYPLIFQDKVNTNVYHTGLTNQDGTCALSAAAGTSGNLQLNVPVTVSSGWTLYVGGQNAYQQLQLTNQYTDIVTGNYDYFHNGVQWDASGVQQIPVSLLYTNGPPSWWGATNPWPAVDPARAPMVGSIPAQNAYFSGFSIPTNTSVSLSLIANPLVLATPGPTTLTWTAANATNVTIAGLGSVDPVSGSTNVVPAPATRTTYTATANGPSGSQSQTVTVIVKPIPPSNLHTNQ